MHDCGMEIGRALREAVLNRIRTYGPVLEDGRSLLMERNTKRLAKTDDFMGHRDSHRVDG